MHDRYFFQFFSIQIDPVALYSNMCRRWGLIVFVQGIVSAKKRGSRGLARHGKARAPSAAGSAALRNLGPPLG